MTDDGAATQPPRFPRGLQAKPGRVSRAVFDADARVEERPPHECTGRTLHLDAQKGDGLQRPFTNIAKDRNHSFGDRSREFRPDVRIRHADRVDNPNPPGKVAVTIDPGAVPSGTGLAIVQEGPSAGISPRRLPPRQEGIARPSGAPPGSRNPRVTVA